MRNHFQLRHGSTRRLGVHTGIGGERSTINLPKDTLTNFYKCRMKVTLTNPNGGAVGAGQVYGGVMNLIKALSLEVNGTDTRYRTTGQQILTDTLINYGKAIALPDIVFLADTATEYVVDFSVRFDLPRSNAQRFFAFDARNEQGVDFHNEIQMHVDWAYVAKVAADVGGIELTSAKLYVEAANEKQNANDRRKLMVERRSKTVEVTANDTEIEIEVDRVSGTVLRSITVVNTADEVANAFPEDGVVTLDHDDYSIIDSSVWAIQDEESLLRSSPLPPEMLHIDLLKDFAFETGIPDAALNQKMKLKVPVTYNAAGKNEVEFLFVWAKPVVAS